MTEEPQPALRRSIGRWSLTALALNGIIGSGIFGLPSLIAGLVGRASPVAYLIAAGVIGVIMACFAEVAARFGEAGGPYLYAHAAFGRLAGIEVGWLTWLVRLTATAAAANLLLISLAQFWPNANGRVPRLIVLTLLVVVLAGINIRGVGIGARVSTAFASVKLISLFAFAAAGLAWLFFHAPAQPAVASANALPRDWFGAILLLMFGFGGFEAALIPMSEAREPSRDAPFALLAAFVAVTVLFTVIQLVVVELLPNVASTDRPLAEAARQFSGRLGAGVMAAAAVVSVSGYLAGQMLAAPRLTFALAERGDFPRVFAAVHPRFRTPYISILAFAALTWVLAAQGSFRWNVALSAVARLLTYVAVCAALPALRRSYPEQKTFHLPAGSVLAGMGVAFAAVLLTRMGLPELLILTATAVVAIANWLLVRGRHAVGTRADQFR